MKPYQILLWIGGAIALCVSVSYTLVEAAKADASKHIVIIQQQMDKNYDRQAAQIENMRKEMLEILRKIHENGKK